MAGSYNRVCVHFKKLLNWFQRGCTILYDHQQNLSVLVDPHSHQHLSLGLLDLRHSSNCAVESHCGFPGHFSND